MRAGIQEEALRAMLEGGAVRDHSKLQKRANTHAH